MVRRTPEETCGQSGAFEMPERHELIMDEVTPVGEFDVERWLHIRSVEHGLLELRDRALAVVHVDGDGGDIHGVLLRFACLLTGFELAILLDKAFGLGDDVLLDEIFLLLPIFLFIFQATVRHLLPLYAGPFRRRLVEVVEMRLALFPSCVLGLEDGTVERISTGRKLFPALLSDLEYVLSPPILTDEMSVVGGVDYVERSPDSPRLVVVWHSVLFLIF